MKPKQLRLLLIIGITAMIVSVVAFIGMSSLMQNIQERKDRSDRADAVLGTLTWDDIISPENRDSDASENPDASESAKASASVEGSAAADDSPSAETSASASSEASVSPAAAAVTPAPSARPTVLPGGGLVPYDNRKFIVSENAVPEAGFVKTITVVREDRALTAQDITWEMDVADSDDVHVTLNGRRLSDKEPIATGTMVELYDGDNVIDTGIIVVPGDIRGSGTIDAAQVAALEKAVGDPSTLQGVYFLAADLDGSGVIDGQDLELLKARAAE